MAQVNGLLDWIQTPAGIGLLSAVAGGMAGAQRGTPWNNAGRAGIAGLAGYTGAKDQINKESDNALTRQYRQMQMQELESKIAQQKALREAATSAYQDATNPAQFAVGGQTFPNQQAAQMSAESMFSLPSSAVPDSNQPLMNFQSEQAPANIADFSGGQTPQITQQQAPDVRSAMYSRLMQAGFPEEAAKYAPAPEEYGTTPFIDAEGNAQLIGKTGKTKTLPFKGAPKEVASPYGQDLREWFAVNLIDPRTATPEQLRAGYAAVNQTKDKRAAAGGVNIGQLGPKYTEGVDKLGAQYLFEQFGEARNAATAVSAVNDAKVLLDQGMFTGKAGPWQESVAGWYQAATGRPIPKLDATQQFKTVIGDIVLPALSNLKGASSDRDFKKIEEYSRGEATMTEGALKNHLDRLFNKYGAQINNFNTTLDDYQKNGGSAIPGLRRLESPAGNIKPPSGKTPANGQTGKSKSGRPIIFRNGQWEYQ